MYRYREISENYFCITCSVFSQFKLPFSHDSWAEIFVNRDSKLLSCYGVGKTLKCHHWQRWVCYDTPLVDFEAFWLRGVIENTESSSAVSLTSLNQAPHWVRLRYVIYTAESDFGLLLTQGEFYLTQQSQTRFVSWPLVVLLKDTGTAFIEFVQRFLPTTSHCHGYYVSEILQYILKEV